MRRKQQGLTLVELMVALAVAIILVTVGMPLFTGIVASNRAAAQTNDLVSALKLARSEAVKRATDVAARRAGAGWADGWTVFVDDDNDGVVDGGEEVLRNWGAPAGGSINSGGAAFISFLATGEKSGAQVNFELDQADASGSSRRCVSVLPTGQVRVKRETASVAWACP